MVEVIALDPEIKRKAEAILEGIIKENLKEIRSGEFRYCGHVPEFSPAVWDVRDPVQEEKFTPHDLWATEGVLEKADAWKNREGGLEFRKNYHPHFRVLPAESIEAHNSMFKNRISVFIAKHTSEGRPVIYITPVGPMGQYPGIADLCEAAADIKLPWINPKLVHAFAMDEWSDETGMSAARQRFPYMSSFKEDMGKQFYDKFTKGRRIPEKNLHFAADYGLRNYWTAIKELLDEGAAVLVTGGVGVNGHISFSESTAGKLLGKELAEQILAIIAIGLTAETDIQNRFTSTGSLPVPLFANTTYIGLWKKFLDYSVKNPGLVQAWFGLDNGEEPLKWQPYIAQCLLAYYIINNQPDPSFAATYVPQFPGGLIIERSLIDNIGKERLAK